MGIDIGNPEATEKNTRLGQQAGNNQTQGGVRGSGKISQKECSSECECLNHADQIDQHRKSTTNQILKSMKQ